MSHLNTISFWRRKSCRARLAGARPYNSGVAHLRHSHRLTALSMCRRSEMTSELENGCCNIVGAHPGFYDVRFRLKDGVVLRKDTGPEDVQEFLEPIIAWAWMRTQLVVRCRTRGRLGGTASFRFRFM